MRLVILCLFLAMPAWSAELVPVKRQVFPHFLSLDGVVEAVNQSTMSAQTSGQVVETLVDAGDLVPAGQLIIRLRDTEQRAEVRRAEAGVEAARAAYEEAEKEYLRVQDIFKRRLVAQSALDKARAARDAAKANLDAAEARLVRAREQLAYTQIRAPYTGIVVERHVHVGETVAPGVPLITGVSLEKLRVTAEIPQNDIEAVRQQASARVHLPNGDVVERQGEQLVFFAYADPKTSTFKVRVQLPEGLRGLYPGMYLKTDFRVGEKTALVIPKSAVVWRSSVSAVYVQTAKGVLFRQVKLGRELGHGLVEVMSGLNEGEQVFVKPATAIRIRQGGALDE